MSSSSFVLHSIPKNSTSKMSVALAGIVSISQGKRHSKSIARATARPHSK